jgi:hypothetical protein
MDWMENTWNFTNYFGNSNVDLSKMEETTNEEQGCTAKVPTPKHTYPIAAQPSEEILTGKFL